MRERSVVRLSVTPSTKSSCSAPPPRLENGRTTIDRLGGPSAFGLDADGVGTTLGKVDLDGVCSHRPRDVLESLLAEIDKVHIDLAADMVMRRARDQNAAGLAKTLEPRGDVDSLAENVVALDQHVAEVDADPKDDALSFRSVGVALGHQLMNSGSAFDCGDDRGKFQQQPVAHRLDDPSARVRDQRSRHVDTFAHCSRRPGLVLTHQAGIADHVDNHDRSESAGFSHSTPQAISRVTQDDAGRARPLKRYALVGMIGRRR